VLQFLYTASELFYREKVHRFTFLNL